MLEPWRSQYLRALGVDVYLPRVILPGARPSQVCEWDWSVEENAQLSAPESIAPENLAAENSAPPVVAPAAPAQDSAKSANRPPVPTIEERGPRREPVVVAEARPRENPAIPQFALSVVSVQASVLIVDDAPGRSAARGEYLRLISNLAFALRGGDIGAPALDVFIWPMVKNNPQIDQSADAAREAIAAYAQKQIHNRALRSVLLLGENAQHWLPEAARASWGVACASSAISAWRCLSEPALKRQLWSDVRHLAVNGR